MDHDRFTALPPAQRLRVLDRATRDVGVMSPRPCGATRCPPTCRPCMTAVAVRIDELMAHPDQLEQPWPERPSARLAPQPTDQSAEVLAQVAERLRQRRIGQREAS